jgi:hypothetical protein
VISPGQSAQRSRVYSVYTGEKPLYPDPDVKDVSAPSGHVHVRAYRGRDWWSAPGVLKNRKRIEKLGLPSFKDWRFITLTLDREGFESPLAGYLAGKERLRRFMTAARKAGLWSSSHKWAWKLEFQKDGWAHWHLLVGRTSKMTEAELGQVGSLWALGRTNVERVSESDFLYSFKYAFKPAFSEAADEFSGSVLPDWFLDHVSLASVKVETPAGVVEALKPRTFSRARFWQTSKGFYTGEAAAKESAASDPVSSIVPATVRDVVNRSLAAVQVVARNRSGRYVASAVVALSFTVNQLWSHSAFHAVAGNAVFLGCNSAVVPVHLLTNNIENKCKLHQILKDNRLRLSRAETLQKKGETFRTC